MTEKRIVVSSDDSSAHIGRVTSPSIRASISNAEVVSGTERSADTRTLVRLALGLGSAYVLFLTFWFWKTRIARHRFGREVRF
jgi:hypothetical protein